MKKFATIVAALALLAFAGTAHAGIGGTMEFDGNFDPRIGINFGSGGTTIDLLAGFWSVQDYYTEFSVGGRFEKAMTGGGNAMPVFGLCADVDITSWDDMVVSDDEEDSWTDFAVGGFLGGRVEIVEDFSIAGHMGVKAYINSARYKEGDSSTDFGTFVNLTLRLTNLWGSK